MNAIFLQSTGTAKNYIQQNNEKHSQNIDWKVDKIANIEMNKTRDGKKSHYLTKLTNQDLENILNVSAVDDPIHKRLLQDFPTSSTLRKSSRRKSRKR